MIQVRPRSVVPAAPPSTGKSVICISRAGFSVEKVYEAPKVEPPASELPEPGETLQAEFKRLTEIAKRIARERREAMRKIQAGATEWLAHYPRYEELTRLMLTPQERD